MCPAAEAGVEAGISTQASPGTQARRARGAQALDRLMHGEWTRSARARHADPQLDHADSGKLLVSAAEEIKVWGLAEGKLLHTLGRQPKSIGALVASADGRHFYSVTGDALAWTRQEPPKPTAPAQSAPAPESSPSKGAKVKSKRTTAPQQAAAPAKSASSPVSGPGAAPAGAPSWMSTLLSDLRGALREGRALAISPDGQRLAAGGLNGKVQVLSVNAGSESFVLAHPPNEMNSWDSINALVFLPDGSLASTGPGRGLYVWDLGERSIAKRLALQFTAGTSLAVHPRGTHLAVAGNLDQRVEIWDLPGLNVRQTLRADTVIRSLAFSLDGNHLVAGLGDGRVRIWTLGEPTTPAQDIVRTGSALGAAVNALAFSPDGTRLIAGDATGVITTWNWPEPLTSACLWDNAATEKGTDAIQARQMGPSVFTQPCGTQIPPDATCLCNCVAAAQSLLTPQTVCVCDTVALPAGTPLPSGAVCTCNTVAVGSYLKPVPTGHERRVTGTVCTCDTVCTCNTISTGQGSHYWYPN